MTETTTNNTGGNTKGRSVAELIREGEKPTGRIFELSGQAARLNSAIKVAGKWADIAATNEETGDLLERAETLHDELEEELSRVTWQMELEASRRRQEVFDAERGHDREPTKDAERVAAALALSDSLIEAYNILAQLPEEELGRGGSDPCPRTRYKLMGALLAAKDVADAELDGHEL